MIFGDIRNYDKEKNTYPDAVRRGLEYIRATDWSKVEPGRYEVEGDKMYAMLQVAETKPAPPKAESHLTYTDIQFLLEGEESMGFARWDESIVVTDDLIEKGDAYLYEQVEGEFKLLLKPGMFTVFYPSDVHRPNGAVNEPAKIRKVVVKIHRDLLGI
ncbi:MAG: YhcH/YjgK/YiaL family protein [Paenibacillaceae bacterium]|nr:YhcH/YjgK/YiaL family protein [Paenibacillaceae bacterium]